MRKRSRKSRHVRGAQEQLLLQFCSYSAFVALSGGRKSNFYCSFTAILPLSLCCLACSAAFVDFYCLSGLLLPLSICCLACSAAFVDFYCLSGHGRLCRLLLPFCAFTAFVDFY